MQRTIITTTVALFAFAANSLLCRMALSSQSIDAASFATIRLLSGALTLIIILLARRRTGQRNIKGRWTSALMLFTYAASFSFAYLSIESGTGTLILFGSVQITMILIDYLMGNRLRFGEWFGLFCAFGGFIVLVLPGVNAPPLSAFLMMAIAGCAWGSYTLMGRLSDDSLADTTGNFVKSLPFVALLFLFEMANAEISSYGFFLAFISGSLATSGAYVLWYLALSGLTTVQAAAMQLLVPVIAAFGGTLFLSEVITGRLIMSSLMVLGGILIVLLARERKGSSQITKNCNNIARLNLS
jgi:drug/metabolite transporter (DMT)-like permease